MSNANTVVDALKLAGIPQDTPLTLSNPGGNNPWLFVAPASPASNAGAPVALSVPCVIGEAVESGRQTGGATSDSQLWYADKAMFRVRVVGHVQPNSFSKTLKLYLFSGNGNITGAPGTSVTDLQIGFASATLPATVSAYSNFFLEALCLWDSLSLQLNGIFQGQIGGTAIAATAFSVNNPSSYRSQDAAGAFNPLQFVVGANLSSSASAQPDLVVLDEFTAEMV